MCFIYLLLLFRFFASRQQQLRKKKKNASRGSRSRFGDSNGKVDRRTRTRVLVLVPRQDDKEKKKKRVGDKIAFLRMLLEDNNNKKRYMHIYIYTYICDEKNESGKQTRLGRTIIRAPVYERHRFTIEKCQFSDVIGPRHAGGGCAVCI